MKLNNYFQSLLVKFHPTKTKVSVSQGARALLHWKIIVISFLVAVVLVFLSSYTTYQNISEGDFFPGVNKSANNSIKASVDILEKTAELFKNRKEAFDELKQARGVSADPSK